MNRQRRQPALLSGSGVFRGQGRLTGFGGTRKIIRIRTNFPVATDSIDAT
jgi:hypothetical protein